MESDTYALEFEYGNKSHICVVDYDTAWIDISALIRVSLDVEDVVVKYVDDENDEVSLNSEDELAAARKLARQSGHVLKFRVYNNESPGSTSQTTEAKKSKPSNPPRRSHSRYDPMTGCAMSAEITMDPIESDVSLATINVSTEILQQLKPPDTFVDKVVQEILQGLDGSILVEEEDTDDTQATQSEVKRDLTEMDKSSNIEWSASCGRGSAGHAPPSNEFVEKIVQGVLSGLNEAEIRTAIATAGLQQNKPNGSKGPVHAGVICDSCNKTIIGLRYKCGHCADFDLCHNCEAKDSDHDKNHVFLKIRWSVLPGLGTTYDGNPTPLLSVPFYPTDAGLAVWERGKLKHLQKMARRIARAEYKHRCKEEKRKRKEMGMMQASRSKREKLESSPETDDPRQGNSRSAEGYEGSTAKKLKYWTKYLNATFVGDVNFSQGTHLQPGTKFTKSWIVVNVGSADWNSGTTLKFLWGNIPNISEDPVTVPHLGPGQQGVVSVQCQAPRYPGSYESHWRLCQDNEQFGQRVWCNIVVDLAEILEPNGDKVVSLKDEFLITKTATEARDAVANLQPDQSDASAPNRLISSGDTELLTAHDILSFEMLKISGGDKEGDQNRGGDEDEDEEENDLEQEVEADAKVTSTPNNTPCGMTPCMSPVPQLDAESLSTRMSNHGGLQERIEETKIGVVEEMAGGRPAPTEEDDLDMVIVDPNNSDGGPRDSSDEDLLGDFCVIPLPDCFDLNKPLDECTMSTSCGSHSTFSTETAPSPLAESGPQPDIDAMLATSHSIVQMPLIPLVAATRVQPQGEPPQGAVGPRGCTITAPEIVLETVVATEDPVECGFVITPEEEDTAPADVIGPTATDRVTTDRIAEGVVAGDEALGREDQCQIEEETDVASEVQELQDEPPRQRVDAVTVRHPPEGDAEGGEVFHDAEDHSREAAAAKRSAGQDDVPRQSEDEIPRGDSEPPQGEGEEDASSLAAQDGSLASYRLPREQRQDAVEILGYATTRAAEIASHVLKQTYAAANVAVSTFLSSENYPSPSAPNSLDANRSPMDALMEMGFGNRDKNRELLYKYNNDVNLCVQDLLSEEVDNWHLTRH